MPGIRQSSTKGEFYRALGLNEQNPEDNRKFEAMWVSNGRANFIPMAEQGTDFEFRKKL